MCRRHMCRCYGTIMPHVLTELNRLSPITVRNTGGHDLCLPSRESELLVLHGTGGARTLAFSIAHRSAVGVCLVCNKPKRETTA